MPKSVCSMSPGWITPCMVVRLPPSRQIVIDGWNHLPRPISTTRWRVVADQKDLKYYFNSTSSLDLFWVDLNKADLRPGAPVRVLPMGQGQTYSGDVVDKFDSTKPFQFVPVPPEVLAAYR